MEQKNKTEENTNEEPPILEDEIPKKKESHEPIICKETKIFDKGIKNIIKDSRLVPNISKESLKRINDYIKETYKRIDELLMIETKATKEKID